MRFSVLDMFSIDEGARSGVVHLATHAGADISLVRAARELRRRFPEPCPLTLAPDGEDERLVLSVGTELGAKAAHVLYLAFIREWLIHHVDGDHHITVTLDYL